VNRYLKRARPLAAFLAIALCSTVAARPAVAAEPAPARPLAAAAEAAGAALPEAAVAQATQGAPAPPAAAPAAPAHTDGKSFFKTTKGTIAVVLTAGALGFMGYSMSHDRVKSPAR
jgi:hypothetical protein